MATAALVGTMSGRSVRLSPEPGVAYLTAAWSPTWGAFEFQISTLDPGDYELFVGDDCFDEASDTSTPCGVTQRFTVIG